MWLKWDWVAAQDEARWQEGTRSKCKCIKQHRKAKLGWVETRSSVHQLPKPCSAPWARSESKASWEDDGWRKGSCKVVPDAKGERGAPTRVHCQAPRTFLLRSLESDFELLVLTMEGEAHRATERAGTDRQMNDPIPTVGPDAANTLGSASLCRAAQRGRKWS